MSSGSGLAIETSGLAKRFHGQLAVAGIDLAVPRGSVYGFLGPNGSGKTTTIRMLLALIQPTSGSHEMLGVPMPRGVNAVLPRVGALVEGPSFYPQLSGRANLARLDSVDPAASGRTASARIDQALERVGLLNAASKRYRAYSLGMKQRLAIASGLLQPRDLMILDEPTNGLDPQGTREVRSLIREIAADGTTIFLSTHLLAEVEQICSHVGVMRAGSLVYDGTLADLRGSGGARVVVRTSEPAAAAAVLTRLGLADVRIATSRDLAGRDSHTRDWASRRVANGDSANGDAGNGARGSRGLAGRDLVGRGPVDHDRVDHELGNGKSGGRDRGSPGPASPDLASPGPASPDPDSTDLGSTDLGSTDLGSTDLGSTDLGGTDLGGRDSGSRDRGIRNLWGRGKDGRDRALRGLARGGSARGGTTRRGTAGQEWSRPDPADRGARELTEVSAELAGRPPEQINVELVRAGVPVAGLDTPSRSLEEQFVELTGEGFDVSG